jgi:nucleoside-triphosphatase THEP1
MSKTEGIGISNASLGNKTIYYRLIALWILNEAMLGGIIHGFKIPVSGLVVGSCAVICICLIAWYVPVKGAIIRATIIVAIFKMMLSPQAPPPAYIAVFFQGLMGELLFWNRRFFKLSCFLFAILALLESGLQRILVLTIIYGNDLWKVINDFINGLTKQKTQTNYSLFIGSAYGMLHLIAALFVGWWASVLPSRIKTWSRQTQNTIVGNKQDTIIVPEKRKKKRLKTGLLIIWIILLLLYVQSYYRIGTPLLPTHTSLKILIRSIIIILTWIFIVAPLLKRLLHYWLQRKKAVSQKDVEQVVKLLPETQQIISQSWSSSAGNKGWKRIAAWARLVLINALATNPTAKLIILSAPIQKGKTTSLVKWSEKRTDVFGILTPVVEGKRFFMNAHTGHLFPMEAGREETETLDVGRFVFSKKNFDRAIQIVRESSQKDGWLIIDEIGPLELRGEGFFAIAKEILSGTNENQKILFVVREGMAERVKEFFQVNDIILINNVDDLDN